VTPSDSHFSASPSTDAMLKAKPPWCSWRQTVTPCARSQGRALSCARRPPRRRRSARSGKPICSWRSYVAIRSSCWTDAPRRCSRRGCSDTPPDPIPTPRRTPASARSSPAGSSCCGRRRRRFPTRPRRASSSRDDDVRARPEPACAQLLGEVVGGRETVDAGADDDIRRCARRCHLSP